MLRLLTLALVCSGIVAASPVALAQEADPQPDIIITGPGAEQVRSFVTEISAVAPSVDQIARWDEDICMSVAGLGQEQAQFIADQVSYRALGVGLEAGSSGCDPNVFIFFTPDSNTFAPALFEERKSLFAYYHEEHVATLGHAALTDFLETPRPVRWWHVSMTRGANGNRLGSDQGGQTSPPPPRAEETRAGADGFTGLQAVRSHGTRLRAAERQDFGRVVVIVDATRAQGYMLESIADYIAMVTLVQIDPGSSTANYNTILNLFTADPEVAPVTMTDWDMAYLQALYRSTRNPASVTAQLSDISRRMVGGGGGESRN